MHNAHTLNEAQSLAYKKGELEVTENMSKRIAFLPSFMMCGWY